MQIEFSRPFFVLLLRWQLQSNMASLVWPKSRNFLGDGKGLGLGLDGGLGTGQRTKDERRRSRMPTWDSCDFRLRRHPRKDQCGLGFYHTEKGVAIKLTSPAPWPNWIRLGVPRKLNSFRCQLANNSQSTFQFSRLCWFVHGPLFAWLKLRAAFVRQSN